jgi:hypothetical protein
VTATLDLSTGAAVTLDGQEWAVDLLEPQYGMVTLTRAGDGERMRVSMRFLLHHPGREACPRPALAADRCRQPRVAADLTSFQRELAGLRMAHLLEVETGYRSGDPARAAPGEPKPEYDPARATLTQRRQAKARELAALDPDQARLLGLGRAGYRTLIRWDARRRAGGLLGCADDRWLRASGGHPSIGGEVREAIFAVRAETLHRSRVSMRARDRLIRQYVLERYGPDASVPSPETLRLAWREWFGPGGARQRYARSAAPAGGGQHVVIHRPGQVVALDTTVMPVKVRETVFGDPVSAHLTMALDTYTHSLVAFRLTLVSDASVDVAMLLRDMMMPLPMREGWGSDLEWPYPGIPASVVAEFAGHRVAGLPFFAPETVTTDHGSVYKNHHLVDVQRVIGANVLPARVLRPTDKQAVERAFGAVRSLLFEHLLGYTGVDVADRGTDPEADAVLTLDEMEHLVATWIVACWQNRKLGGHAPCWDPGGEHSPNTLFAAAMSQGGFSLEFPEPELFYELLPASHVKIHGRRGVKVRGLWYDGPCLDPYRDGPSARGGQHPGRWVIRRDPRDARTVFFQDPAAHTWHALRWAGLPPEGEVPCFGDKRASDLLAAARQAGLRPRSDAELLPLLLRLLGAATPVSQWPTQLSGEQRTRHARESSQGQAARRDRPQPGAAPARSPQPGSAQRLEDRAGQAAGALDGERRRRREQALAGRPVEPPPRLGAGLRRGGLFSLSGNGGGTAEPGPGGDSRGA